MDRLHPGAKPRNRPAVLAQFAGGDVAQVQMANAAERRAKQLRAHILFAVVGRYRANPSGGASLPPIARSSIRTMPE